MLLITRTQFGIEFGYVGGDPAELMRICVENGTFTVAFLKEGVQKVRSIANYVSMDAKA